ncbi:MAG: thiolase family protein [Syntrophomonadaceae bacterium]
MSGKLNQPVYLLGAGCTKFGNLLKSPELQGLALQDMVAVAVKEALADAKTDPGEIDAYIIGNHTAQSSFASAYSQLSKWIGMDLKAGVQMAAACSTTNVGAQLAAAQIAAGVYDKVLVVGFEATQTNAKGLSPYERELTPTDVMWLWTDGGVGQAYSVPQGYDIFPVYNGLIALGYCRKFGISIEDYDIAMMELCRTRRLHGSLTPQAVWQETLEDEAKRLGFNDLFEFWTSEQNPFLAWPTRLHSLVTAVDGASAMVLSNQGGAKDYMGTPIEIKGMSYCVGDLPWYKEDTVFPADAKALAQAYQMAGIAPQDLGYCSTHDCSHISGIRIAEQAGWLPEGKGLEYAREGRLRFDGDRPMHTHGGRHAFGHAWAASAGSDIMEAMKQIRGEAGPKQIKTPPEFCLVHNHGYAMISSVMILKGGI